MAQEMPGRSAVDIGGGKAATFYTDGTVLIWDIATGQQIALVNQGDFATDLGGGLAGSYSPGGQFDVWNIGTGQGTYSLPPPGGTSTPTAPKLPGGTLPSGQVATGNQWWMQGAIPSYLQYAQQQPGYLPGSMTYNQWRLDEPGLLGTVGGVPNTNLQYGSGSRGDPTTGREPQTPDQWMQGPKLFQNNYPSNWGQDDATQGLGFIANLFLRSDTSSGIGTPAFSAPQQYWQALGQQIANGRITPTARGWQLLAEKGLTPQQIGGAAMGANGQPNIAGGGGGLEDALASKAASDQAMQAAQLVYQDWYMRTQDDKLAWEKAKEAWSQKFQEAQEQFRQQQWKNQLEQSAGYVTIDGNRTPTLQGIAQEAGLTGLYQGKPTFQREQYESGVMQNLLGLQAGLRGPENYSQYLKVLGSTPQGMRDVVNAAAGRFTMPSTSGVTPGQQTTPANVQSLLRDVTSGGAQQQADWSQALSGGLPNPNQFNLANWNRMLPTQQKMLLSAYEGSGWDPNDVLKQINQSAPTFTGPTSGSYRF